MTKGMKRKVYESHGEKGKHCWEAGETDIA